MQLREFAQKIRLRDAFDGREGSRSKSVAPPTIRAPRAQTIRRSLVTALYAILALAPVAIAQEPKAKPDPVATPPVKEVSPEAPVKTLPGDATDPDPASILKKAEAACRSLKSVRYSVRTERIGATGAQRNLLEGSALVRGWKGDQPERFRYEMRFFPGGKDVPREVVLGYDGEVYYSIDASEKKVTAGPDSEGMGRYGLHWKRFAIDEFVRPRPFQDEISGSALEYRGPIKIGEEECDTVFVRYASGGGESVWYFSKKDHLPRRVDRKLRTNDGATVDHQWVATNLKTDANAGDEAFKLKVPEGFSRTDIPPK